MTGRVYRLRRKSRQDKNNFYPAEYNDVAKNIDHLKTIAGIVNVIVPGIGGPKILDVYFKKGKTSSSSIVTEVLEQSGITPKTVAVRSQKRVRYTFASKADRDAASSVIGKMAGDKIILSSIDYSTDPPTVKTKSGLEIELDGWNRPKSEDPEYNTSSYGGTDTDTGDFDSVEDEKKDSPNWFLIAGAAVVGVILVLAIVKLSKK